MTKLLSLLLMLFSCQLCQAQAPKPDSTFLHAAIENTIALYNQSIKGQAHLYNGSEYVAHIVTNNTHPYFISDDWVFGSVHYDRDTYNNVPLLYDIYTDQLITEVYYSNNEMALIAERVDHFNFDGHTFKRLIGGADKGLSTGFYEILYDGETKVIAKRKKVLQEKLEASKVEKNYEAKNTYYVLKDDRYFNVKSKGSIIDVLSDKKTDLKQFSKKNKLKFKKDRETSLKQLAQFYDSITKN